jgi:alkylation response protein AidB-like acyl-CoA dehydrogenase
MLSDYTDRDLSPAQLEMLFELRAHCEASLGEGRLRELTRDYTQPHSEEFARGLAERGWWGLMIDPRYGGAGGGFGDVVLFMEETFRAQAPIAGYIPTFIVIAALNAFGSEAQRAELLGAVAAGGVLAISITEPLVGSDAAAVATRARSEDSAAGPVWVINGHKRWCTSAHLASHILVFCRTGDEQDRHRGLSMIFVPCASEGLTITPICTPIGHVSNEVRLQDVRVPSDALLGEEGNGWAQAVAGLNAERVILAASSLGLAQRAFDDALAYVQQRTQFGRPVGSFQAQQHRFADLATELLKTRLLVRWVAELIDEDPKRLLPREASMAKLAATELAKRCALEGMQAMGANGYDTEYGMARHLQAALGATVYGGTSEIQRNIIAKTLGL